MTGPDLKPVPRLCDFTAARLTEVCLLSHLGFIVSLNGFKIDYDIETKVDFPSLGVSVQKRPSTQRYTKHKVFCVLGDPFYSVFRTNTWLRL